MWVAFAASNSSINSETSQMPRHLISDAHEWINEIPTVPIYYLANFDKIPGFSWLFKEISLATIFQGNSPAFL